MNIDIGSKIKTLRLSKSMTQEQLAKALHVSAQAVSKWENGSSLPDIQLLPALSVTLGTSIDSLFSLTDESRFARIDNMLWDKRFLTQQEFDEEEHFLQEKCREEETRPRATLLLAELYCKRAREYNDLASPLARQALALNLDCKEAHNAIFDAEHGAYLDWNATNHYRTIAFYQEFLAAHPENHSAHLWLLDLLIADRRCAEAREVLDKMHRLKPTYNDDFYLGCILLQEGHTDDALALSQEELAEKVYVTRQTVSNWETGKSYPDIHSLLLLSALFDVSLDQLIKGDLETMKQEVNAADVRAMNRDGIIFSILLAATIILPVPLIKWFGLYGLIPELLLWGSAMYFALRLERIKKANNVQSYKEILAFSEGRKLDEIEQKVEAGKRPYQKLLLVLLTAGITLLVGMVLSWLLL